jgi:hypothetical protein
MAVEKDQSAWLPEPPPPRPARRDAAIDAALRKFDGVEDAVPAAAREPRRSWASTHRPQVAVLVSAMLLLVVGIPAALIGIRNEAPRPSTAQPTVATRDAAGADLAVREEKPAPAAEAPRPKGPPVAPRAAAPAEAPSTPRPAKTTITPASPALVAAPPAPPAAAAAPPPPPPPQPPPAPVARGERDAAQAMADNVVVTGSRIANSKLAAPNAFESKAAGEQGYSAFLSRLQTAVKAKNRRSIVAMIDFPLRVNFPSGARQYRNARSVESDFDRIFTEKVMRAVLRQRADRLFVRDQGAMVGDGELWFRETCPNSNCLPAGPVRIVAVNP